MTVVWPLSWMRHERTPGILKRAYNIEMDSEVKAHIVRVAASLMSAAGEEILRDALRNDDEAVKKVAGKIMADRGRAGGKVLTYDETAHEGVKLENPHLGR